MTGRSLSTDDGWLLQVFVLIRAVREPVSEETLVGYAERHELHGITTTKIRRLLSTLVRRGLVQAAKGKTQGFVATRQGKKAADEARSRLTSLMSLLDRESSR